jgi:hypothetical protein
MGFYPGLGPAVFVFFRLETGIALDQPVDLALQRDDDALAQQQPAVFVQDRKRQRLPELDIGRAQLDQGAFLSGMIIACACYTV